MKRSEALEEIRKILDMNGKDDGYGELEEAILHHLEVIGMLPPASNEFLSQNPFSLTDAILDSISQDFKWDEE